MVVLVALNTSSGWTQTLPLLYRINNIVGKLAERGEVNTLRGVMIAPGFESHQCLTGIWKRWLGCYAGCQEVGRCRTRGMCNMPLPSVNKAAHSGFETQRRHHQKSETRVSVAPQKRLMSTHFFLNKKHWLHNPRIFYSNKYNQIFTFCLPLMEYRHQVGRIRSS